MGQPKDLSLECDVVEVKIYSILHMYHNTSTSIYSPNLKTRKYNKKSYRLYCRTECATLLSDQMD